jgi:hypothetical protein
MSRPTHEEAFGRINVYYLMEQYVVEATVMPDVDEAEWVMVESLK